MVDENRVDVEFGASTADLKDGIKSAADTISGSAKQIVDAFSPAQAITIAFGVAIERFAEQVLNKLKGALDEAVHAYANLADAVEHTQHRLGGAAEEISVFKVSLDSVGLSLGTFESIARRLPMILEQHEEDFKRAGVAYQDANGKLLPTQQTIMNVVDHLNKFTAGAARNEEGVRLLGRSFASFLDLIELTPERMAEATKVANEFGLVLGGQDLDAANEFSRQTALLQIALHGFYVEIGKNLTPVLTQLAVWTREQLVPAFAFLREVLDGIGSSGLINTMLTTTLDLVGELLRIVTQLGRLIGDVFMLIGNTIAAIFGEGGKATTAMETFKTALTGVSMLVVLFHAGAVVALDGVTAAIEMAAAATSLLSEIWSGLFSTHPIDNAIAALNRYDAKIGDITSKLKTQVALTAFAANAALVDILAGPAPKPVKSPEAGGAAPLGLSKPGADLSSQLAAIERAKFQAALDLTRENLKEEQVLWDDAYARSLVTTKEYYDAKLDIELRGIDASIAAKNQELDSLDKISAAASARPGKADEKEKEALKLRAQRITLEGQLNVLLAQRAMIPITNDIAFANEEAARNAQLALTMAGMDKASADNRVAIERSRIAQMLALRQIDMQTALVAQKSAEDASFRATKEFLDKKLKADLETTKNEKQTYADYYAAVEAADEQHQLRLTEIDHQAELDRQKHALQAIQSVQDAFAGLLNDFASGTKSMSDMFTDFANSVVASINRILAQKMAEKLFASTGPTGSNEGGLFSGLGNLIGKIFSFDVGTNFVPNDMFAFIHKGERITAASQNNPAMLGAGMGGGGAVSVVNHFSVSGSVDRRTQEQIGALAGLSIQRAMARNT